MRSRHSSEKSCKFGSPVILSWIRRAFRIAGGLLLTHNCPFRKIFVTFVLLSVKKSVIEGASILAS